VIIIAHRLSAVRQAHRIVAMDRGCIAEAGTHDALIRQNGLYAHLWRLQAGLQSEQAAMQPAAQPSGSLEGAA